MYWSAEKQQLFLKNISDLLAESKEGIPNIGQTFYRSVNSRRPWPMENMVDLIILAHMQGCRKFDDDMVALLRFFRNMINHHFKLPTTSPKIWDTQNSNFS
ncbi:hypothetical protein OROHE_010398 [Orobanche hederae]